MNKDERLIGEQDGGVKATPGAAALTQAVSTHAEFGEEVTQTAKRANAKLTIFERVEAWISKLSTRNTFWHRVCSLIWLPYAFKSGIWKHKREQQSGTFTVTLPFRRVNRNWYNAMAGAALLGNSEIAGGMYVFDVCGADYTVVCKQMTYKFLRPCFGPALYRITPREDIKALLASSSEFNITLDLVIVQQARGPREKEKRVGRCEVTFHVTPKSQVRARKARAISE